MNWNTHECQECGSGANLVPLIVFCVLLVVVCAVVGGVLWWFNFTDAAALEKAKHKAARWHVRLQTLQLHCENKFAINICAHGRAPYFPYGWPPLRLVRTQLRFKSSTSSGR